MSCNFLNKGLLIIKNVVHDVLEKMYVCIMHRFIARLEEQIHEWKLNTVVHGPPLTKVIAVLNLVIYSLTHKHTRVHTASIVRNSCKDSDDRIILSESHLQM